MKIAVINGSPKANYSTTLQTVLYLELLHPEHEFKVLNAAAGIKRLERDFSETISIINEAELILFSYPVYTFIAPSQLHRFISLMKKSGMDLSGKYASQITTSKHFYDVTAHKYIEENCSDMGLKFINGLSADMDDLLKEQGRKNADSWFKHLIWSMENGLYENQIQSSCEYKSSGVTIPAPVSKNKKGDVVIVADIKEDDAQLTDMIIRFRNRLPYNSRLINIHEFPFKGGCIGCLNCASDGKCIYNDGFDTFLREKIQTADAIITAFTISDHSMGTVFKTYDDRQFCNGHRTVTAGIPFGYIISGPYSKESNLKLIIEARAEVGGNYLTGAASDESDTDSAIDTLVKNLDYAIENNYVQSPNFYGVGGSLIFRDLIWTMRGFMKADHKFFKKHGLYNFPQKQKKTALMMYMVGALVSNPKIKAKMGNKMSEGMIAPYKKVLENAKASIKPD